MGTCPAHTAYCRVATGAGWAVDRKRWRLGCSVLHFLQDRQTLLHCAISTGTDKSVNVSSEPESHEPLSWKPALQVHDVTQFRVTRVLHACSVLARVERADSPDVSKGDVNDDPGSRGGNGWMKMQSFGAAKMARLAASAS